MPSPSNLCPSWFPQFSPGWQLGFKILSKETKKLTYFYFFCLFFFSLAYSSALFPTCNRSSSSILLKKNPVCPGRKQNSPVRGAPEVPVCGPKVLSAYLNVNIFRNFSFTLIACAGKSISFPKQVNTIMPGRVVFRMPSALWLSPYSRSAFFSGGLNAAATQFSCPKRKPCQCARAVCFCHGTHGFCFYHGWPVQWEGENQCPFSKCQWNRGGCSRLST